VNAAAIENSLSKKITKSVGKAIGDFDLINHGDRILVALSGGKDSWSLLYALLMLQSRAPIQYEISAVTVDLGTPQFNHEVISQRLAREGVTHHVIGGSVKRLVDEKLTKGTNPCSLCSRFRRGFIYTFARLHGWNKIALGHHRDDFVETLMLNLFFNGSIKGMSPNLLADDMVNTVIRPLVYVSESLTTRIARNLEVPLIDCGCHHESMAHSRRQWVKGLLAAIEKDIPDVKSNILAGMQRIHYRHLLGDKNVKRVDS
jgi:tRNA 2-thiocytidine biosynthesis protein TtcA